MPPNTTKNYSLFAVVVLLLLLGSAYYVYSNLWPTYQAASTQYEQLQVENSKLQQALKAVENFVKNFKGQEANAAKVNLALPAHQIDLANFISSLQQLAQTSGVVLTNFQIDNTPDEFNLQPHTIQAQDITFGATGSYLALKDFMVRLETHLRLVDVYQLTLASSDSSNTGTPVLQYNVRLRTYYQR